MYSNTVTNAFGATVNTYKNSDSFLCLMIRTHNFLQQESEIFPWLSLESCGVVKLSMNLIY